MIDKKVLGIFGVGGFGREIMPIARISQSQKYDEFVFVDDNPASKLLNGHDVYTYDEFKHSGFSKLSAIVTVSDPVVRSSIEKRLISDSIGLENLYSNSATLMDNVSIGEGTILCSNTIITSNIKIGRSFHCNINSYVAHDCIIGDYVTFGPSVHCNGNVIVQDNAYVGTGAIIKQGEKITLWL